VPEVTKRDAIDRVAVRIVRQGEKTGQKISQAQARERVRRGVVQSERKQARRG